MAATPLLIDTDIGDDIDDAFALAFAVRSPELELAGVTTVFQCTAVRARLAQHLLAAWGRAGVPVVPGVDRPLLGSVDPAWRPNQAAVLAGAPEPPLPAGRAVDLIVEQGMRREGLVLAPIGAMTNVALALAVEPRLVGRVRVVAMAGAWDRGTPEWNVRCDPEALAMVLASGAQVDFVGLDVTTRCRMRAADVAALGARDAGTPEGALLAYLRAWQRAGGHGEDFAPLLHDPLAVAAVFRPDLLQWERGLVTVDLRAAEPGAPRGVTRLAPTADGPHRVARGVDVDGFLALFGDRVCDGAV